MVSAHSADFVWRAAGAIATIVAIVTLRPRKDHWIGSGALAVLLSL